MPSSFVPRSGDFDAGATRQVARLPAWLLSLLAHLALALGAAVALRQMPPRAIVEADRPATIVLARRTSGEAEYFDEDSNSPPAALKPVGAAADALPGDPATGLPAEASPPTIIGAMLPASSGVVPAGDSLVAVPSLNASGGRPRLFPGQDDAAILAEDARIPREKLPTGPTAGLSLFGAPSTGRSFVFVIDRSASMGDDGVGAIRAAARELAAQLGSLTPQQSVQAIAYNEAVARMEKEQTLLPATDRNKTLLTSFVGGLAAFGPTEHSRGLIAALKLKPEVIYLLTDGGPPALDAGQLRVIGELSGGRVNIHVLHFGKGSAGEGQGFLERLAAENGGTYTYIDMAGRR